MRGGGCVRGALEGEVKGGNEDEVVGERVAVAESSESAPLCVCVLFIELEMLSIHRHRHAIKNLFHTPCMAMPFKMP